MPPSRKSTRAQKSPDTKIATGRYHWKSSGSEAGRTVTRVDDALEIGAYLSAREQTIARLCERNDRRAKRHRNDNCFDQSVHDNLRILFVLSKP